MTVTTDDVLVTNPADAYSHVALVPLSVGNVLAFMPGDYVPGETVESMGWDDTQVALKDTAEADAAQGEYDALTVTQMKAILTERGLSTEGNRPDLLARLQSTES